MAIKIDINVPIPAKTNEGRPLSKYGIVVLRLEPGESFFFPTDDYQAVRGRLSYARMKFPNNKYMIRKVEENGRRGYRLWRAV